MNNAWRRMGFRLIWACLGLVASAAWGEPVTLTLPNKVVVKADYREGDPSKPALVLLHGFLQTHHFPTITRLAESLSSEGYTVLAPTLSLGVTHRNQSIACEAIHTHTLASGVDEINAWVKWLRERKRGQIILMGHSLGNLYNLAYLSSYPDKNIKKFIGISIVEGRLKAGESARSEIVRTLRKQARSSGKQVLENQFSFCQKFRSSPASVLSYMEWGPDKILQAVQKSALPVTMIMGSRDDRLGPDWLERLKKSRAKVIIIDGANHFMDGQHEFDLMDRVLEELKAS